MKQEHTYAVTAYTMNYRQGTSNKFYHMFISERGECILRWGRIGTAGQSSYANLGSYSAAHDQGMKQVYAKRSKGYVSDVSDFKFLAGEDVLKAAAGDNIYPLSAAFQGAVRNGEFSGAKDAVLKHYTDLAERVKALIDRAADTDSGTMIETLDALDKVWAEINDKHAEVEVAMNLARATAMKNLMGI